MLFSFDENNQLIGKSLGGRHRHWRVFGLAIYALEIKSKLFYILKSKNSDDSFHVAEILRNHGIRGFLIWGVSSRTRLLINMKAVFLIALLALAAAPAMVRPFPFEPQEAGRWANTV